MLGVVIGITSIVGMTSLIRGFDESFKDMFRQIGPKTMFVTKFSFVSFSQGKEFRDPAIPALRCLGAVGVLLEHEAARAASRAPLAPVQATQIFSPVPMAHTGS